MEVSNSSIAAEVSTLDSEYLAPYTGSDAAKGDKECMWQESTTAAEDVVQDNKGQATIKRVD
jgi:hypothetical protein